MIALDLIRVAGLEHPALRLAIAPAERIGDAPELLDDRHLREDRQRQPAMLFRHIHERQAHGDARLLMALARRFGDAPFIHLGFELERAGARGSTKSRALSRQSTASGGRVKLMRAAISRIVLGEEGVQAGVDRELRLFARYRAWPWS